MQENNTFITGINYWPASKAMYWWHDFAPSEVARDFKLIAKHNLKVVRIFLQWENFQPYACSISPQALANLKTTADLAYNIGIQLMPTFFCGHMSGVNWFPEWLLKHSFISQRFPIYSGGKLLNDTIRNYYTDDEVIKAQMLQIREVCSALKNHPAIMAYDLGNEPSNCIIPPNRELARQWLKKMSSCIKNYSDGVPITLGMHAEDLEEDRQLWPEDAADYCDFLSMHAYPFYLSWAEQPLDANILPFLGIVTSWLAGKSIPLLMQEFGAPSQPASNPLLRDKKAQLKCPLFSEEEVCQYYRKSLALLQNQGFMGALAWCYSDYAPDLWASPPLRQNIHERYFGLFHHDNTSKPAAATWAQLPITPGIEADNNDQSWLQGFYKDEFYVNPQVNLKKMYSTYQEYLMR